MDFMAIFDLIIGGFGVYLIFTAFKMRKTGEISTIVVNKEDINKCKDKAGFIDFIFTKAVAFGLVALLFGVVSFINDSVFAMGAAVNWIGMIVFLILWIWFTHALRKGREKFFYI